MHETFSYEGQFDRWQPNSTTIIVDTDRPYTEMDNMAKALVECERTKDYVRYDWIANLMLDSLEVNAYLNVLCKIHNSKPADTANVDENSPKRGTYDPRNDDRS